MQHKTIKSFKELQSAKLQDILFLPHVEDKARLRWNAITLLSVFTIARLLTCFVIHAHIRLLICSTYSLGSSSVPE